MWSYIIKNNQSYQKTRCMSKSKTATKKINQETKQKLMKELENIENIQEEILEFRNTINTIKNSVHGFISRSKHLKRQLIT